MGLWLNLTTFAGSLKCVLYLILYWIPGLADALSSVISPRMKFSTGVKLQPSFTTLALFLSVLPAAFGFSECGDYYKMSVGQTGVINSPDYPSMYPTYSRCIWQFESPGNDYRVQLTFTFTGERYNGTCSDYLEIREGGQYAPLIGTYCDTHTNEVVISGFRWLWVFFRSDALTLTSTVMTATFTSYYNATPASNTTKPYSDCRSYEFECRNKMCSSMSYRCDGYNDCGCKDGCDEDACYSHSLTKGLQIGISVSVGLLTFIFVCILSFLLEGQHSWTNSLSEAKRERETSDEARRKRVSRAFSKFIGNNSGGSLTRVTDSSYNNNASYKTPPSVGGKASNGAVPTGPPRNTTAFNIPDMTVTDIDA